MSTSLEAMPPCSALHVPSRLAFSLRELFGRLLLKSYISQSATVYGFCAIPLLALALGCAYEHALQECDRDVIIDWLSGVASD